MSRMDPMDRAEQMNQTNEQEALLAIQEELDAMSGDVPEMPSDFREGWRKAIREDSEKASATASGKEEKSKSAGGRRWTAILSMAAAMVFLIGGTLATRGKLSPRLRVKQESTSVESGTEEAIGASGEMPSLQRKAAQSAPKAQEMDSENILTEAMLGEAFEEEPADAALEGIREDELLDAGAVYGLAYDAEVADGEMLFADEAVSLDSQGMEIAMGMPEAAVKDAEADEETAAGEVAAVEAEADIPEAPEERTSWTRELGYFLEDMGAFLLAALPWLAGLGICAALVLLIRRKRQKRQE